MVKLFILALVLSVGGAILGMTTDLNPALLIITGFGCGLIASVRGAPQQYITIEDGVASRGADSDARTLAGYRFPQPDPYPIGPFTSHSGGLP